MGLGVQTYVCMDSHITTNIFEIDAVPNFLRYGVSAHVPSLRTSSATILGDTDINTDCILTRGQFYRLFPYQHMEIQLQEQVCNAEEKQNILRLYTTDNTIRIFQTG